MIFGEPWQVLSTCPYCRVENSLIELMDPAHPAASLGRPVEQRCRLCGFQTRALDEPFPPPFPPQAGRCPACKKPLPEQARSGQAVCPHCRYTPRLRETHAPGRLDHPSKVLAGLSRWAEEEGEQDVERFCQAHMGGSAQHVADLIVRGERVPTSFDVVAWLFPSGPGGTSTPDDAPGSRSVLVVDRPPRPTEAPKVVQQSWDPRGAARLLVSVMAADGEIRSGERRFIERFLRSEGLPELAEGEWRIWRTHEIDPPADVELRGRLLEACVHLMHLDRQRDGTEWKVVRAFAAAWGVADDDLDEWDRRYDERYATVMTRLWNSLTSMVRVR